MKLRPRRVEKVKMQRWRDLPSELLSSVMAYLEIKDNIRASLVCKSWYEAGVSVRVVEQPPWLFRFSKPSNSYELYDPSNGKKHKLELPESLTDSIVHYSADGWLLMSRSMFSEFFLFDPFTRKIVVLPYLAKNFCSPKLAFSCAPTSSSCVVFLIKDSGRSHVTICTWSPGQTMWTSIKVTLHFSIVLHYKNVIFSNGLFYCVNLRNSLAVFDPSLGKFDVLDVPPPGSYKHMFCQRWYKRKFIVETKGHIYVIFTYGNYERMVFELNLEQGIWEEKRSVGSLTMFVTMRSCESRSYVGDGMKRNSIYFPKLCSNETCTMTYSFHEKRYSPCEESIDWVECPDWSIWITPPENVSELLI